MQPQFTNTRQRTGTPDERGERTGALGHHRFGMAIGAAIGLAACAAIGAEVFGTGGGIAGAVIGALLGAWAGKYGAAALRPMAGDAGAYRAPPAVGASKRVPAFRRDR